MAGWHGHITGSYFGTGIVPRGKRSGRREGGEREKQPGETRTILVNYFIKSPLSKTVPSLLSEHALPTLAGTAEEGDRRDRQPDQYGYCHQDLHLNLPGYRPISSRREAVRANRSRGRCPWQNRYAAPVYAFLNILQVELDWQSRRCGRHRVHWGGEVVKAGFGGDRREITAGSLRPPRTLPASASRGCVRPASRSRASGRPGSPAVPGSTPGSGRAWRRRY